MFFNVSTMKNCFLKSDKGLLFTTVEVVSHMNRDIYAL